MSARATQPANARSNKGMRIGFIVHLPRIITKTACLSTRPRAENDTSTTLNVSLPESARRRANPPCAGARKAPPTAKADGASVIGSVGALTGRATSDPPMAWRGAAARRRRREVSSKLRQGSSGLSSPTLDDPQFDRTEHNQHDNHGPEHESARGGDVA